MADTRFILVLTVLICIGLLLPSTSIAESLDELLMNELTTPPDPLSLKGRYTQRITVTGQQDQTQSGSSESLIAGLNRLRFSPQYRRSERLFIQADIDGALTQSTYGDSDTFDRLWRPPDFNDFLPLGWHADHGATALDLKIHRLYAKLSEDRLTITVGRQQIRFGSGRIWNPLDLLNPISPILVDDAADQKGTDALRLEYFPTPVSEWALVVAPKRENDVLSWQTFANDNTNILLRYRATIGETDLAAMGGRLAQAAVVGADLATIVLDGLLRAGLIWMAPDGDDPYPVASVGYEYTFAAGIYFLCEYFYNPYAVNHDTDLAEAYVSFLADGLNTANYGHLANRSLTFNRHYFGVVAGYDLTPLLRCELSLLADAEGKGLLLIPVLRYSLTDNAELSARVMAASVDTVARYPSEFAVFEKHPLWIAAFNWYF